MAAPMASRSVLPSHHHSPPTELRAQVWNKHGTLIGRIVVFPDVEEKNKPYSVANFNFCPDGKMFINAEDRIFVAQLSRNVKGAL